MEAPSEDKVEEIASNSQVEEQEKGSERPDWSPLFGDPSESSESLEVQTLEAVPKEQTFFQEPLEKLPEQQTLFQDSLDKSPKQSVTVEVQSSSSESLSVPASEMVAVIPNLEVTVKEEIPGPPDSVTAPVIRPILQKARPVPPTPALQGSITGKITPERSSSSKQPQQPKGWGRHNLPLPLPPPAKGWGLYNLPLPKPPPPPKTTPSSVVLRPRIDMDLPLPPAVPKDPREPSSSWTVVSRSRKRKGC